MLCLRPPEANRLCTAIENEVISEDTFDNIASRLSEQEKALNAYEADVLKRQQNAKQHLSEEYKRKLDELFSSHLKSTTWGYRHKETSQRILLQCSLSAAPRLWCGFKETPFLLKSSTP